MDLTSVNDLRVLQCESIRKALNIYEAESQRPKNPIQTEEQSFEPSASDRQAARVILGDKYARRTLENWLPLALTGGKSDWGDKPQLSLVLKPSIKTALMFLRHFRVQKSLKVSSDVTSVGASPNETDRGRKVSRKPLESRSSVKSLAAQRDTKSLKRFRSQERSPLRVPLEKKPRISRSLCRPASIEPTSGRQASRSKVIPNQSQLGRDIKRTQAVVQSEAKPVTVKVEQAARGSSLFNRPALPKQRSQLKSLGGHLQAPHVVKVEEVKPEKVETEMAMTLWDESVYTFPAPERRPALAKTPPIWAATRQEVCESFEFFKSYQGGVYFSGNAVKGYLLSGFPAKRDIFAHDGMVIISHGGGGSATGQTRLGEDTDQRTGDKSVRALLNNHRTHTPLVLLIDERYSAFPFSLASKGVTYAVLGLYIITHAWAEYQPAPSSPNGRVEAPWWLKSDSKAATLGLKDSEDDTASLPACTRCSEPSPTVYKQGWFCLNPECFQFWKDKNGKPFVSQDLTYDPSFLEPIYIPDYKLSNKYRDLRPPPPTQKNDARLSMVYDFSRGWHCKACGRLTCRFKWQHWECGNSDCKAIFKVRHSIRTEKDLRDIRIKFNGSWHAQTDRVGPTSNIVRSGVKHLVLNNGKKVGHYQTYTLPDERGKIHHIVASSGADRDIEADEIFKKYQEQAASGKIAFQRWPLRAHKLRTPLLTNYFSQNCGEPYQYVGGSANTISFDKAPSAVVRARDYMHIRVNKVLVDQKIEFNEVLSAAYMERQKMAFHSDAERGLGPVVAGVSFGSPAFMHFRLLKQYVHEGGRKEHALSVILKHGDVLIMEGSDIQKYYEHCVSPANFRISATGRCIAAPSSSVTRVKTEYRETNLIRR